MQQELSTEQQEQKNYTGTEQSGATWQTSSSAADDPNNNIYIKLKEMKDF